MRDASTNSDRQGVGPEASAAYASGQGQVPDDGPRSLDGVSSFIGIRWEDPQTVRLQIRPELINAGGLLSGVVTFALVDYCMGSTLWAQTTEQERIATINISINYIQTATEGEIVCRTVLDRRNRANAVMKSEVRHEDGRLLVTAIGSYSIFTKAPRATAGAERALGRPEGGTAPGPSS
jgi:1,4-dihydroxy-2-naphthoyl-CoA hydrolase